MRKIIIQFIIALTLLASGLFLLFSSTTPPVKANELRLSFLNVGQGDAILVNMPDGSTVLIDGGPDTRVLEKLDARLGNFKQKIDLVILTHPHLDHVNGLLVALEHYEIGKVVMTGTIHTTSQYLDFLKLIDEKNIPLEMAKQGLIYNFGEATLEILYPEKDLTNARIPRDRPGEGGGLNDTSVVSLVAYKNKKILLMGDASREVEKKLLNRLPAVDILKVGHHGSKYSSSPEFLRKIKPRYSMISLGAKNDYHHPHYRALKNLTDSGTIIYRTDIHGDIEAIINEGGVDILPEFE